MANGPSSHQSDPLKRARLRWRARRGLLENDLLITRFFDKHELDLDDVDISALSELFELPDNDLLDLLLARCEPQGNLARAEVSRVLGWIRAS